MKFLRNTDSDTLLPFVLTTGLILLLSAAIIPVVIIMVLQDLLFFSHDHLTFIRPQASYQWFAGGMVLISLTLFSLLFTKMYAEKKRKDYKLAGLHLFLLALALPVFGLSVYHYMYLDEEGVQENPFWSISEESISWDEVTGVVRTVEENTSRTLSYTFENGEREITIPYDSEDFKTARAIRRVTSEYEWEIRDVFVDTGESLKLFEEE